MVSEYEKQADGYQLLVTAHSMSSSIIFTAAAPTGTKPAPPAIPAGI